MHLLYVVTLGGGVDTSLRALSKGLIQKGHQVSFLYIRSAKDAALLEPVEGVTLYETRIGNFHYYLSKLMPGRTFPRNVRSLESSWAFSEKLAEIIKVQKPDLIEIPEMFVLPRSARHIPYIVRLHSADWTWCQFLNERERGSDKIDRKLETITLRLAAGISSPSRFLKEYVSKQCRIDRKVELIPHAVDTELFKPSHTKADAPVIFFAGRVERRKGAHILIKAMPKVLEKYPKCQFVFAGHVRDDVKDEIKKIGSQAIFLGFLSQQALMGWYQKASIFIAPALWDNSPNTIYEAMSCGTPVIATRVGGIPELVEDGVTGLLISPGDPSELTEKIFWLLNRPAEQEKVGKCARERVVRNYNVAKITNRTLAFYKETINCPK